MRSVEEYINEVVAAAPPLTAARRDRLAMLLRPTVATRNEPDERARYIDNLRGVDSDGGNQ